MPLKHDAPTLWKWSKDMILNDYRVTLDKDGYQREYRDGVLVSEGYLEGDDAVEDREE